MAEKVIDKLRRLSRDLADSVRAEIELVDTLDSLKKELAEVKACVAVYVSEKEGISLDETISFIRGYRKAKQADDEKQIKFSFSTKNR